METLLSRLIEKLAKAEAFEDAAEAALGTAVEIVRFGIAGSAYSKNARVLRAILHHRPDDGYRRLVAIEVTEAGATGPIKIGDTPHMPSAAAWQWVRGHETAASIDVALGTVTLASGKSGTESTRALQRDATHLFVVPVRAPGHRIEGMIAVETTCQKATGTPFVWDACREALLLLAAIAAPYFTRLPVSRVDRTAADELLPVIGQSTQGVVEMLKIFARQDEPILMSGPAGSGKAGLARWVHERSSFRGGPFEVVRLASIPEDSQIAEIFGVRKATPGAPAKDIPGAVARAEKGTLFLADVDRLTPSAQTALARLLDEKRYRISGEDSAERTAQVRFLFGTTTDLNKLVEDGRFRADLFYRMDALPVRTAPLRERPDEIIEWAETMLRRRHAMTGATSAATITQDAASRLVAHDWPGNLRQLDNILRRSYALAQLDHASTADGIAIRAEHIERALQYEGKGSPRSLLDHLDMAAEAFVAEAERRTETGVRLDMDLADSFKGLVIEAAKRRWSPEDKDGVKKAFLLLGKEATVKSRNHWATYEREFEKVQELKRILSIAAQNGHSPKAPSLTAPHGNGHSTAAPNGNGHAMVAPNGNGHAMVAPNGNGHQGPHHPATNGNHGLQGTNGSPRVNDGAQAHGHGH